MAAVLVTGSARAWLFPIKTDEWITRPDAVSAPPMLHHTPRAVVRTTASSSAKCRMSQGGGSVGQRCTTGPMSGYEAETRSECAHCEALAALERDFPVAHAAELRRFLKKVYVHMHRCAHTHTDTRRHHVQCIHACVLHVRMRSMVSSILPLSAMRVQTGQIRPGHSPCKLRRTSAVASSHISCRSRSKICRCHRQGAAMDLV